MGASLSRKSPSLTSKFWDLAEVSITFEADDIAFLPQDVSKSAKPFLGRFSLQEVAQALTDCGIAERLASHGVQSFHIDTDSSDDFVHKLFVWLGSHGDPHDSSHLLVEMFIRQVTDAMACKGSKDGQRGDGASENSLDTILMQGAEVVSVLRTWEQPKFLVIEWARMQNPTLTADASSLFPGQEYPSLGCSRSVMTAVTRLANSFKTDGILNYPMHFHNAFVYVKFGWVFVNPVVQGLFETLLVDLRESIDQRGLAQVAKALVSGGLKAVVPANTPGEDEFRVVTVRWHGQAMLDPLSARCRDYLLAPAYAKVKEAFCSSNVFFVSETTLCTEEEWRSAVEFHNIDTRGPPAADVFARFAKE